MRMAILTKRTLREWGRLIRLPNLFTAPWDSLCGLVLAGGALVLPDAVFLGLASLTAYLFGLVTNDLSDYAKDCRERPGRPLPSGGVSRTAAIRFSVFLFGVSLCFAWSAGTGALFVMLFLLGMILLYNFGGHEAPNRSSILMALCRVLSVFLGAASALPEIGVPVLLYCGGMFCYIFGVTKVSRSETESGCRRKGRSFLPLGACLMLAGAAAGSHGAWIWNGVLSLLFLLPLVLISIRSMRVFAGSAEPWRVQKEIGFLIRGLLFAQSAVLLLGNVWLGIMILLTFPLAGLVSRRFYGS